MAHLFLLTTAALLAFVSAQTLTAYQAGCADSTREGFSDVIKYPKIAACRGTTTGISVNTTQANALCAANWHVCTGADINAARNDPTHHTAISIADAASFGGKYAYNANNDCGSCQDTCGARAAGAGHTSGTACAVGGGTDPDLACMGSGCGRSSVPACLANGRMNSGNSGCTVQAGRGVLGFVCCRDDYKQATEEGDLETVFSADFQPGSNTQRGYEPVAIPGDNGLPISFHQDGIAGVVSGYSHRRAYGNPSAVVPLIADDVLLNRRGTITVSLSHVPPGKYLLTTYHNDASFSCGGCFPISVTTGNTTQTKYVRVTNARSLSASGKAEFNITVGGDQAITITAKQTGRDFATSGQCPGSCASVENYQGTCGRCTRSDAHLGFNGLNLKAPTSMITSTTTSTTTRTTHTVQQDVNRTLNELYERQTLLLGRVGTLETDLSTQTQTSEDSADSLQGQIYDVVLDTSINTEAINGGGDTLPVGLLQAVQNLNDTINSLSSTVAGLQQSLSDEISRNDDLRTKLRAITPMAVTAPASLDTPQVSTDASKNVNIMAGTNGKVMISGSTCDSVDFCDAMSSMSAIAQALKDAAGPATP